MKGYRKTGGAYIELYENVPVHSSYTEVALRPSPVHVFTDTWSVTPLNADTCWRLPTVSELNAVKDADMQAFLDSVVGKAVKTIIQVGIDKGVWTLADLRAKYRTF